MRKRKTLKRKSKMEMLVNGLVHAHVPNLIHARRVAVEVIHNHKQEVALDHEVQVAVAALVDLATADQEAEVEAAVLVGLVTVDREVEVEAVALADLATVDREVEVVRVNHVPLEVVSPHRVVQVEADHVLAVVQAQLLHHIQADLAVAVNLIRSYTTKIDYYLEILI